MAGPYWIGIDGGGSKTEAVLIDAQGAEIARATSGPSNYHHAGREATAAALRAAIEGVLRASGEALTRLGGLGLGIAGAARPADRAVLEGILAQIWPLERVFLTHDAAAALAGGVGALYGAVLIAGTGAIAYGANRRGASRRADGWGYLLGDEGSGYWIGRAGLRAALRADDGRGPATALSGLLAAALDADHPGVPNDLASSRTNDLASSIVGRVYQADFGVSQVAALAPLVSRAAAAGDAVAGEILAEAGRRLAGTLGAVIAALDLGGEAFEVVLAGGVLRPRGPVRDAVVAHLGRLAPRARAIDPRHDAAYGAALLARQRLGKEG